MIRHCVMLRLRAGYNETDLAEIISGLRAVAVRLDGCTGFFAGPNRDFEGKSPGFPFGFTLDFDSASALASYASDAAHVALGRRLIDLCEGGAAGILVYDLDDTGATAA